MKKGLLFILMVGASVCLSAQEKGKTEGKAYTVETNRFGANWFISGGVGGQMYFGDNDGKADFGKRIAPALDIAVGKWFTPGIGLRVAYNGLQAKELLLVLMTCIQKVASILTVTTSRNGTWLTSMVMFSSTFLTCSAVTTRIVFIHSFLM